MKHISEIIKEVFETLEWERANRTVDITVHNRIKIAEYFKHLPTHELPGDFDDKLYEKLKSLKITKLSNSEFNTKYNLRQHTHIGIGPCKRCFTCKHYFDDKLMCGYIDRINPEPVDKNKICDKFE